MNNSSMLTADRMTHLKIVVVSLVCATIVAGCRYRRACDRSQCFRHADGERGRQGRQAGDGRHGGQHLDPLKPNSSRRMSLLRPGLSRPFDSPATLFVEWRERSSRRLGRRGL